MCNRKKKKNRYWYIGYPTSKKGRPIISRNEPSKEKFAFAESKFKTLKEARARLRWMGYNF